MAHTGWQMHQVWDSRLLAHPNTVLCCQLQAVPAPQRGRPGHSTGLDAQQPGGPAGAGSTQAGVPPHPRLR